MTHIEQALDRALADPRVTASFTRLTTYRNAGTFDQDAALRLLRNNARDHTRFTPSATRDALARALLDTWLTAHA